VKEHLQGSGCRETSPNASYWVQDMNKPQRNASEGPSVRELTSAENWSEERPKSRGKLWIRRKSAADRSNERIRCCELLLVPTLARFLAHYQRILCKELLLRFTMLHKAPDDVDELFSLNVRRFLLWTFNSRVWISGGRVLLGNIECLCSKLRDCIQHSSIFNSKLNFINRTLKSKF